MLSALLIAITVLTWNTGRMGEFKKPEKNEVLQYLLQQDADVVCLQEVDVYKDDHFLTLPDVKKTLSPKYPYSYLDFSVFNKRHQYGTMVWSKYPLIHKQSIHYESFGNLSNRCDIVVGKDTFRLFNNHLESYKLESEDLQDVNKIEQKWKRAVPVRNKQGDTYTYKGFGLRIDYILCSDPLKPIRCTVPKTTGSDHKPVVATLEW